MTAAWISVAVSIVTGALVNEVCDVSPWLARRMVRKAARLWSLGDSEAAEAYEAEWVAVIEDAPGKITKLVVGSRFLVSAFIRARAREFEGQFSSRRVMRLCIRIGRTTDGRVPSPDRVLLVKLILWAAMRVPRLRLSECAVFLGDIDGDGLAVRASEVDGISVSMLPRRHPKPKAPDASA